VPVHSRHALVEIRNLKKYYSAESSIWGKSGRLIYAVNDVSFNIYEGETLGLVGESGCGKTTTGKLILRLLEATEGEIHFGAENISKLNARELTKLRRNIQIIFQDPYSSLNPRKTVGKIIENALIIHNIGNARSRMNRVLELLNIVGLLPEHINRYPHEFSGGQRQRIGIARALAIHPKFIVCDEPVSALDVSIQAQILNLLEDLQKKFNLTYLFIAHNFSVVKHISRRIAVMYLGKIVETGNNEEIHERPLHPYTQFLLSAIPVPDPDRTRKRKRMILEGDVPSPINLPSGCFFHPRCPHRENICMKEEPQLINFGGDDENEHLSACHFSQRFTGG
jgi:peptide/nickel transport system ATP-binding protein/oligopeptide transport system ATP-binding protein